MAFDLEGEAMPLTEINDPGVFTGTHQDARALGRKLLEQRP